MALPDSRITKITTLVQAIGLLAQVHVPDANWNVGVWSRGGFIAGLCKEMSGLCPLNNLNSSIQNCKAFLKAK